MANRIWHVFWLEYWQKIKRPSFLLFTLGLPIFIVVGYGLFTVVLLLALWLALPEASDQPIALVDDANLISADVELPTDPISVTLWADISAAETALEADELQAIYYLPADYWETGEVRLIYNEVSPNVLMQMQIQGLVSQAVRREVPPDILRLYRGGTDVEQFGLTEDEADFEEAFSEDSMTEWLIVFVVVYLVQQVNLFASVRVYDSITSEAENRTLEILITSVTPLQFVLGKLSGLMLAGLTQLGIWAATVLFLVWSSSRLLGLSLFSAVLAWEYLGLLVSVLLAAHVLNQILAAAFGLLRMSGGLGAQLLSAFGLITTLGMLYILYVIPPNPDTWLAIGLSLFPLTMPIALPVRAVVSTVPQWQVILAQSLMWLTNILGLLWVRYLVRANLVKYSAAFSIREWMLDWLRQRRWWPGRKQPKSTA